MKIEDLKNARLSESTAGYLALYLKMESVYDELCRITNIEYDERSADQVNAAGYDAIAKVQEEIMNLAVTVIQEHISMPNDEQGV